MKKLESKKLIYYIKYFNPTPPSSIMQIINTKILILIYIVIGLITAYFAKKNNKNIYLWFSLGVLFGIWPLIVMFFLNYKRKKKLAIEENATLKDMVLMAEPTNTKLWYYLNSEEAEKGPMSVTKLFSLYKEGNISKSTYVWNEDLENWKYLEDTDMYNIIFNKKGAF